MHKFKRQLKNIAKNKKGLSFLEAIISLFVFVVIMVSISQIFTSSYGGYRKASMMQKNIESVQFAINTMAKSLRTSTIYPQVRGTVLYSIVAFDHSEGQCKQFSFDNANGKILTWTNDASREDCGGSSFSDSPITLVSQFGQGKFVVTSSDGDSDPKEMGRVTINFKACSNQDCSGTSSDWVILQTSVSLRDYNTVGL